MVSLSFHQMNILASAEQMLRELLSLRIEDVSFSKDFSVMRCIFLTPFLSRSV